MRTRSKSKADREEKKEREDFLSVTIGAECTTDNRKKSKIKKVKMPRSATFQQLLETMSQQFSVTNGKLLRVHNFTSKFKNILNRNSTKFHSEFCANLPVKS